jgi:hypothetical protein
VTGQGVAAATAQLGAQELSVVAWRRKRKLRDVPAKIKGGSVHPQRPAQPSRRYVKELPEPRCQMQPPCDSLPNGLDPEPAVCTEQAAAVEHHRAPMSWGKISSGPRSAVPSVSPRPPDQSLLHHAQPGTFDPLVRAASLLFLIQS